LFNKPDQHFIYEQFKISHLNQQPVSSRLASGLKSVLFGSRGRPDDSLAGFFIAQWRKLASANGAMKKPRGAIAHREALGKALAGERIAAARAGNPIRVTYKENKLSQNFRELFMSKNG
jgi:hypothetical protein